MVHDMIVRFGDVSGGGWGNITSNRLYDLRMIDFAELIANGNGNYPPGTEVFTSDIPDEWTNIENNKTVQDAVQEVQRERRDSGYYTFTDMPGVTDAIAREFGTDFDNIQDMVNDSVTAGELASYPGVTAAIAEAIIAWLHQVGYYA